MTERLANTVIPAGAPTESTAKVVLRFTKRVIIVGAVFLLILVAIRIKVMGWVWHSARDWFSDEVGLPDLFVLPATLAVFGFAFIYGWTIFWALVFGRRRALGIVLLAFAVLAVTAFQYVGQVLQPELVAIEDPTQARFFDKHGHPLYWYVKQRNDYRLYNRKGFSPLGEQLRPVNREVVGQLLEQYRVAQEKKARDAREEALRLQRENEAKAREETRLAQEKAREETRVAQEKMREEQRLAQEMALATQRDEEAKALDEKRRAREEEQRAREEKREAEDRALQAQSEKQVREEERRQIAEQALEAGTVRGAPETTRQARASESYGQQQPPVTTPLAGNMNPYQSRAQPGPPLILYFGGIASPQWNRPGRYAFPPPRAPMGAHRRR